MMNLEKMKQKKSKNSVKKGLLAATTILCLTSPMLQAQSVLAAENTAPAITIEKPDGWRQGETTVAITVDASHMPEGFSITKIEAKAGKDGSWQDVTGNGSISITGNQTVYVRVTDGEGKVYEQNRSIKCYDTEKPTLSASLTDGVLTIQGNDTVSGITSVTVNGTTYTDLKDGMLRVQLTQKDFTTKQIEITVTDGAGNTSEKYVLQNPYYEWAKKQAEKQKTSSDSNGAMATTTSADATGTEKTTTSPLPQDAQASEPTDAKGKKTKQEGFKTIEKKLKQFFGIIAEKEEPELDIWAGKHYGPCDSFVSEHFTQPPKQYTEDTLLSAMERAGNEELTEDTEKKGLGTPATRAAIIEKLIQSGFVKREKKNLVPTDDGDVLITVLPDEIKSPKMTAEWEMALNHIAQNTETADEFLNGITELIQELVARYQGISEEKKNQFQGKAKGEVIGKCPRCGADVREGKVNFYCSDRNCAFTLWKNDKFLASQGKKMDKVAAKKFLSKGKIHYKDLVSRKTGRQYEATVEMVDPGEGNVQFNLIFPQR